MTVEETARVCSFSRHDNIFLETLSRRFYHWIEENDDCNLAIRDGRTIESKRYWIGILCENKNWVGASIEKNRFTGMTVNCHSSLLHSKGHDLDHIQKFAHGRIPVVLQCKIVIVNCNKLSRIVILQCFGI